jgi:site-specific recombinase XerC
MPINPRINKYDAAHAHATIDPRFLAWLASWERHMRASDRSPKTLHSYKHALLAFARHLSATGAPSRIEEIQRGHVEEFLLATQATHSPWTLSLYFHATKMFFQWLVEEGEIPATPLAKLKRPKVPESTRGALKPTDVVRLVKACEGNDFADRRAMAIVRLFIDTGLRISELTHLTLDAIDFDDNTIQVLGKGRRPRTVPFGRKTAAALDKYLRARLKHPLAEGTDAVWLGQRGHLSVLRVRTVVEERAAQAGLHLHPHLLRHTFAHLWLESGGQEGDLKSIGGWKSDVMYRYAKNFAADRAREAHKRHSPGDRF